MVVGVGSGGSQTVTPPVEGSATGGRKKLLLGGLVLALALGGFGYWFVRPSPEAQLKPGEVMTMDPITLNLARGRYLRVGLALQLVEGVEEVDGSVALDATIDKLTGVPVAQVSDLKRREELQEELTDELKRLYPGEVVDSYFVLFVIQ